MRLVAGIDIENTITETALARIEDGRAIFLASGTVPATGIKGIRQDINGIFHSLTNALEKAGLELKELSEVRLNEAAPVIDDATMETITETIITESTMIGYNPATPGGVGVGVRETVLITELEQAPVRRDYIAVASGAVDFEVAARLINRATAGGHKVTATIVQRDDDMLIHNRLTCEIPIVDEVALIGKVPIGMCSAVKVVAVGGVVGMLSNPYGIATLFDLSSDEIRQMALITQALIGNCSAVVVKTPAGNVKERKIPAGTIELLGEDRGVKVDVDDGADKIIKAVESIPSLEDVRGEPGTNIGSMPEKVRQVMANLTSQHPRDIKIQDLLAVDIFTPQKVQGGLANEFFQKNAVGITAMVKADRLQMEAIAREFAQQIGVPVEMGGVKADMAIRSALTTPGINKPLITLDMGAGSTDVSTINAEGRVHSIYLAGAGNMVILLIQSEMGLPDFDTAEDVRKCSLAKVGGSFHIRHENDTVEFFQQPLDPNLFAKVVILKEGKLFPLEDDWSMEKIWLIRQQAKQKAFVANAIRALTRISPTGNVRDTQFVVLVGGSTLDLEVPQIVTDALSQYKVVAGRGNIRDTEGPRDAVATGLVLSLTEGRG